MKELAIFLLVLVIFIAVGRAECLMRKRRLFAAIVNLASAGFVARVALINDIPTNPIISNPTNAWFEGFIRSDGWFIFISSLYLLALLTVHFHHEIWRRAKAKALLIVRKRAE